MNKISNVSKGETVALFNNIAIETSALCNRHCHFCPNDYFKRPDQLMSDDMYFHVIKNLHDLHYKGRIEFYIYNEPTRDKRMLWFIEYARQRLPSSCLMFSTNGDYFKGSKDIRKFFDAGLNQMLINIYSANDGSDNEKAFKNGVGKAWERYKLISGWMESTGITNQWPLYHNIGAKKQTLHIANKYGVRKGSNGEDNDFESVSNRSGYIKDFRPALKEPLVKHCCRPFRFLNINWKGDALLCCNDYYGKLIMGNVNQQSLEDIWNGEKFNIYRLRLQNKNRNQFLCNVCDSNGGYYPHMINKVTFGEVKDKEIMNKPYFDLNEKQSNTKKGKEKT